MPDIDWNLESSVGEHKITSSHIALLIGNRFKAAIRETLVLPNCENVCIPWMLAEKNDWVPREVAPFIWVHKESGNSTGRNASNSHPVEAKIKANAVRGSKQDDEDHEKAKNVMNTQPPSSKPASESASSSKSVLTTSVSNDQSLHSNAMEDLKVPPLRIDEMQESRVPSRAGSLDYSVGAVVAAKKQIPVGEDLKSKGIGRRVRMMHLGKKMGEKLKEKRRHIEERGRNIVEKMRGHDI